MFKQIFFPAAVSGIVAAFFLTVMQQFWVTPLILQAETYEIVAESLPHQHSATESAEHTHEDSAWKPEDGWQRTLATASSNVVMAVGFALILSGIYTLRHASVSQGVAWGLAGYAVFFAAPSLGLPPELPATAAADLLTRQSWWLGTVFATSIGLALIFLQNNTLLRLAGFLILISPHLLGAPQPEIPASLSPESLQNQFRLATALTNALFWLVLGGLSAALFNHFSPLESDTP